MSARYSHLSSDHKQFEIEKLVQPGGPKEVQMPRRNVIGASDTTTAALKKRRAP